jgi:hypothetical protein
MFIDSVGGGVVEDLKQLGMFLSLPLAFQYTTHKGRNNKVIELTIYLIYYRIQRMGIIQRGLAEQYLKSPVIPRVIRSKHFPTYLPNKRNKNEQEDSFIFTFVHMAAGRGMWVRNMGSELDGWDGMEKGWDGMGHVALYIADNNAT